MNNAKHLKNVLLDTIETLTHEHHEFLVNQASDFTRNRKLSFEDTVKFIITIEAGSLKDEVYKYFGLNIDNPTASAFVQQRQKISSDAFRWLFECFNRLTLKDEKY